MPEALRSVDPDSLRASVRINAQTERTYTSNDFPSGIWRLEVNLVANQNNEVTVQWYTNDALLLEETGVFFWDGVEAIVRPRLNFITSGDARFDSDCDGVTNLAEIYLERDPLVSESGSTTACDPVSLPVNVDLNGSSAVSVIVTAKSFEDEEITEPVTQYQLPINVREIRSDVHTVTRAYLTTARDDNNLRTLTEVSMRNDPEIGRTVSFSTMEVVGSPVEGAADQWQGRIIDVETGETFPIGVITIEPVLPWRNGGTVLAFRAPDQHIECINGLPSSTIHFGQPVVNGMYSLTRDRRFTNSDCLRLGGGFNESLKMVDDQELISLTVGRL